MKAKLDAKKRKRKGSRKLTAQSFFKEEKALSYLRECPVN
jgi:hypothetical protein